MALQTVKRWGNSLAVRIPAGLADALRITEDQDVEISAEHGALVIKPAGVKVFSMARYLDQLRSGALEIAPMEDWGDPKGSELGGPDDPTRFDTW
jgi:antitoxin MazE